jgi:hypothetical protein
MSIRNSSSSERFTIVFVSRYIAFLSVFPLSFFLKIAFVSPDA